MKRGDPMRAYDQIVSEILPYSLENGSAKLKLNTLLLLAKVCLQLANRRNLMPENPR